MVGVNRNKFGNLVKWHTQNSFIHAVSHKINGRGKEMRRSFYAVVTALLLTSMIFFSSNIHAVTRTGENLQQPNAGGGCIDIFTQRGGIGLNVNSSAFALGETVLLFANVTYNGWPQQQEDVAFQIINCHSQTQGFLFATTNSTGIAQTYFTLPNTDPKEYWVGDWTVIATASIEGATASDTLCFSAEVWLEVPYQNQDGTEWCAPTSLAMTLQYYGIAFHSWDYAELENLGPDQGASILDLYNFIFEYYYPQVVPEYGYYNDKELMLNDIMSNVSSGYPVILPLSSSSGGAHDIVIVGYNESGLFVNDPSGALFKDPGFLNLSPSDPRYPQFFVHAYIDWADLEPFADPNILSIHGASSSAPSGNTWIEDKDSVVFAITDPQRQLEIGNGLQWTDSNSGKEDNIVPAGSSLSVKLYISNNQPTPQSFEGHVNVMSEGNVVYELEPESSDLLPGFSYDTMPNQNPQPQITFFANNLSQYLEEGVKYYLEIDVCDSKGIEADYFCSPPFFWGQGQSVMLEGDQRGLYLHVYDAQGNHVGLNYTTNETELEIPGSYYHDESNGTILIALPRIANLTVVVDARYAEEPVEPYNLTVTLETELGSSTLIYEGSIVQGAADKHHLYVPPNGPPIIDDTPPCTKLTMGDPKYVTPNCTYVTNNTSFTMLADDGNGSGVAETEYRISNDTYDTGWTLYTAPFELASFSEGSYTLSYNSTDNAGNVESSNAATIIVLQEIVRDIGVDNVNLLKTVVGSGFNDNVSIALTNYGNFVETFNVTLYANATAVWTQSIELASGNSTTETFTWNTTGLAYGNYTVSAYAWPVPDEIITSNNNFTAGTVYVGIPGDLNGDGTVNIFDAVIFAGAFNSKPSSSNWNPNADMNGDGSVDIFDAVILAGHFSQHYP
jgi:hypothetical protein